VADAEENEASMIFVGDKVMKPKISPARDRQLKRLAVRILGQLGRYGWLTSLATARDQPKNLVLDELRRAEARRKT
jgi:hypothetical protein